MLRVILLRLVVFASAVTIAALAPSRADGGILFSLATKICVGAEGGGVALNLTLNHGWTPSTAIRFRARVFGPDGRRIYPYGRFASTKTWDVQSDFYRGDVDALYSPATRPGVYTVQLETLVLRSYRFASSGEHVVGVWERWPPFLVRAYRCR